MTHSGTYLGLKRQGTMRLSDSPLQKMSFETCFDFLRQSITNCQPENMNGPSSSIVLGQQVKGGTGIFDVLS